MRTITVVTVARSDFGLYLPVLRRIDQTDGLAVRIIAAGAHLSRSFGHTIDAVIESGYPVSDRVDMLLSSTTAEGISKSIGLGVTGFAQAYGRERPELLLVLGDRYEMLAAVLAAVPFGIPIAHIHGGELTEGAFDDGFRHSITKLSHLHFVATDEYGRRVVQLGEEEWRVTVSGAPGIDMAVSLDPLSLPDLEVLVGMDLSRPPVLLTYHPVTLEYQDTERQFSAVLEAVTHVGRPVVCTFPGADTSSDTIVRMAYEFAAGRADVAVVPSLGSRAYHSLMRVAAAMIGNSSSGLIESPTFCLPAVNVGSRQRGRVRGRNVIDTGYDVDEIARALERAVSEEFRKTLDGMRNPYGDGHAAQRIVDVLASVPLDRRLLDKSFVDIAP